MSPNPAVRRHQVPLFDAVDSTEAVVAEAVEFCREVLPPGEETFVGFSGGKDSVVLERILRMSGRPYRLFYSFTGIDAPPVPRFIRKHYPETVFLRPRQTFWRKLSVAIPPGAIRWCCELLKKEPAWKLPHAHRAMGIRAEESPRRASYPRSNHFERKYIKVDHWQHYPIQGFQEWHLWEFIHGEGIPYVSMYDQGFDRVGCVVCPFHSEPTGQLHAKYRERWPGFFEKWESAIGELWRKRRTAGRIMNHETPEAFLAEWYRNKSARWYAPEPEGGNDGEA